jgi:hypothetical protein
MTATLLGLCLFSVSEPLPKSVYVKDFFEDYRNEIAGDKKYKGKTFIVEGRFYDVGKDELFSSGGYRLRFDNTRFHAFLFSKKEAEKLGKVKSGDYIYVRGHCVGEKSGYITFEDCRLVSNPNIPKK